MSWLSELGRKIGRESSRFVTKNLGLGSDLGKAFGAVASFGTTGIIGGGAFLRGEKKEEELDVPEPFAIPSHLQLTAASGLLSSRLAKKQKRAQTSFTGGLEGGGGQPRSLLSL